MKGVPSEEKLELAISAILILGVISSVAIETVGIVNYYFSNGNLTILFQPSLVMQGGNFFTYSSDLIKQLSAGAWTPIQTLAVGIVVLMITPYIRVVASVVYFGLARSPKYLLITLFVLAILTVSLLIH